MKKIKRPPKPPSPWNLYYRTERLMMYIEKLEKRIEELEEKIGG